MKSTGRLIVVTLTIGLNFLTAQFVNTSVEMHFERLAEQERIDIKTLESQLPGYFDNYNWLENIYGMQIQLRIDLFPQSVNTSGFERVFTTQLLIANQSGDQRFFEKQFRFVYNTNDPLIHQDLPHSLTSTLDFYAWMMLAAELDTYEPLGGNNAYEKARDIATRAQMSERPQGFKERLQDLDEILRQRNYRLLKYYFWQIVDLTDRGETKGIPEAITNLLLCLERTFEINARERYTHIFLDVRARELALFFGRHASEAQQRRLLELNPDNKAVYLKQFKVTE